MAKTYNELDYTYAVARLRSLEKKLLTTAELEKLINADNAAEAVKTLASLGWKSTEDFEELLHSELVGVFSLIEELGGASLLKVLRTKYDYHNLKAFIKGELTSQNSDGLVIDLGNIAAAKIKNAILNRDYRELSEHMQKAIPLSYEQYARIADAQLVDIIFDSALLAEMLEYAKAQPEEKFFSLIKIQLDMHNIKTFIRVRNMGRSHGFIERVIADGGNIPPEFYISKINSSSEGEGNIFDKTPYAAAFAADTNLERELDNMFLNKVKAIRQGAFGLAPLAAYFWMKENEIKNVRIILTCKRAGINEDAIRQRLRG